MRSLVPVGQRTAGQGLTTVVFVDLERSTELLDRVGDEAGAARVGAQLDRVRERVDPYGGVEVKALGDGLMLTFTSPRQAVGFALACQRALTGSAPKVRFGINTGEVLAVADDPLGGAVNAAARIADQAEGGEVLVSDVVRQLVGPAPAIRFQDRGRRRLKGFSDRVRLWTAEDSTGSRRRCRHLRPLRRDGRGGRPRRLHRGRHGPGPRARGRGGHREDPPGR